MLGGHFADDVCCFSATWADSRGLETREHHAGGSSAAAVPSQSDRLRERVAREQGGVQHVPAEPLLSRARDHPGPALLRGHRHVVAGLRRRRALPGLAPLSGLLRVRPDPIHQPNARPTHRTHAQQRIQDAEVLLSRYR